VSAGALQIGNGGTSGSLVNQGGIVNNASVIFNRSDSSSYGGSISGSGSVTKLGAGTFILGGSNSYAGDTIINSGVMQYNVTSNLGSNSNAIVFNGGTLRQAVAGTQARNVTLNAGGGGIDTNGANATFSGNFSGAGGLTKAGGGTLTLSGINNFNGGTSVSAGRLTVSGASTTLGTGNVSVLGSGTALEIQNGVANAIDDAATLSLFGGGTVGLADQGFADLGSGIIETVASLLLGGVAQTPGTYGSTLSGAMFQNDEYFAGTGIVEVPAIGDYNGDFKANAADYVSWRKDSTLGGPNGYETWRENFDQSAAASPNLGGPSLGDSLVPEPTSVALMLLGLGAIAVRRRAR
jgi:autotransporter-associated beta strand protein